MSDTEEWRPCPGYEGLYEVSNLGRVKTLGDRVGRIRILATGPDQEGYPMVPLTKDKRRTCKTVHRLVALAFHGDKRNALHCEVAHLDGVRTNAKAENLKWVSKAENRSHRVLHGTDDRGERNYWAKLTEDDVREIRARTAKGEGCSSVARAFGVHEKTISNIRDRKRWKHVTSESPQSGPTGNAQPLGGDHD